MPELMLNRTTMHVTPTYAPKRAFRPDKVALNLIVIVGAVLVVVPFAWVVLSSFKPQGDIFSGVSVWWPRQFTLENYAKLQQTPVLQYAQNSLTATAVAILIVLPVSALAGFAFARFR